MTPKQALGKCRRLWGKSAIIRDDGRPSSSELRAEHVETLRQLMKIPPAERGQDWRSRRSAAQYYALHYRCAVGRGVGGIFFAVAGKGDNFQDAIDDAKRHGRFVKGWV